MGEINKVESDSNQGRRPSMLSIKNVGILLTYYAAAIIALTVNHWLPFKVTTGSVLVVVIALAPFIVSRVSQLSVGNLVSFQLREIGNKVDDRLAQVGSTVDDRLTEVGKRVDDRLAELASRTHEYLTPQPLALSDQKAEEIRRTINLSAEEVADRLISFDPNLRVPAYMQLQVKPEAAYLLQLTNCFWLESYLASSRKETRPLWQLIVAVQRCSRNRPVDELLKNRLMFALQSCLAYLESDDTVDTGGQCKRRMREVLGYLKSH